jgi:PAS domain S-box-containing protein
LAAHAAGTGKTYFHISMAKNHDSGVSRTAGSGSAFLEKHEGPLFRNMIDAAVRLGICFDAKGHATDFIVLEANKAWEKMTGISRTGAVGKRTRGLFQVVPSQWFGVVDEVLKTKRGKVFEYHAQSTDRWFKVSIFTPRPDECVLIFADITESKKAEEKIRCSEETFRTMINAITEAALLIEPDGTVFAANRTVAGRLGQTVESIKGKNIFRLLPPDESRLRKKTIDTVLSTGKPIIGEIRREDRFLQSSVNPVFDNEHRITRIAIFATDISVHKKMETMAKAGEERLRAMLEGSSDMIQVVDDQGILKYISPSMKRIMGYDPQEAMGDTAFKIVHPDDRAEMELKFREVLTHSNTPVKVVCRCLHKNGQWRHIETWAKNDLGNPAIRGIVFNIRDVSDHIQAQTLARESEEKFRSIIEQSHDGIAIIDDRGTIMVFNAAQERLTGIPASEAVGKKIWDVQYRLVPREKKTPRLLRAHRKTYLDMFRTGKADWLNRVIEVHFKKDNGSRSTMQTLVSPIMLGKTRIFVSFNRDITNLRHAEKELEEQNRMLQQKNIALREVMAQLEVEKKRIGEQVRTNLQRLVHPLIDKIRARSGEEERKYFEMLEENLDEITSGFGQRISHAMIKLTQKEIELCDMVKRGLRSKEIGRLMNISYRTVETHRNRIRKKLAITDPSINLASYLKTI